MMFYIGK